jgi:hypothetical protein
MTDDSDRPAEFDFETWFREMANEHTREIDEIKAKQSEQIEKILRTGNDRDKALLTKLQGDVNELIQLNEQVDQGRIRSMPDYGDPARPGIRYINQLDYEIWRTDDPDTQSLFRELFQEAVWWRQ